MTTAYEKAIDYLSRREHSRLELKQKLCLKKFSGHEIDSALDQLAEKKHQSDLRFAESYVYRRKQAGLGPLKITAELIERGVSENIISVVVNEAAQDWQQHMQIVWRKKFSTDITKDKPAQCRFLYSRGFSAEMINRFLF